VPLSVELCVVEVPTAVGVLGKVIHVLLLVLVVLVVAVMVELVRA
jgi:hypothetical protein